LFIIYFISNSLSIITTIYLSHIGLELYIVGGLVSVAPLFRFLLLATLYGRVMERVPAGVLYKLSVVAVAASTALLVVKNPFAIAVSRIVAGVFGTFLMPLLWNSVASSAKMITQTALQFLQE
jgi:MFS family permease